MSVFFLLIMAVLIFAVTLYAFNAFAAIDARLKTIINIILVTLFIVWMMYNLGWLRIH
jgi:hypothetical protein